MLSYQHAFHAGNHADILKHLVLAGSLDYMTRKAAPLLYVDTHAGSGCYRLNDHRADKTGEARRGILALDIPELISRVNDSAGQLLGTWFGVVSPFLQRREYPGSPSIAARMLRNSDRIALYELHRAELENLTALFDQDRRVKIYQEDGYNSTALLPPVQKRALVLVDPSYELQGDYRQTSAFVKAAWKRLSSACLLLWYPVVQRADAEKMIRQLVAAGIPDLWQIELGIDRDAPGHGMTASGMIVINPPWQLPQQLRDILPHIQGQLAPATGHWSVNCLVNERSQVSRN